MKSIPWILALLMFFSSAFCIAGVSRVGNMSIGSDEEGFSTLLPAYYPVTLQEPQYLVLQSPGSTSIGRSTDIRAFSLSLYVPDWSEYTRKQWIESLEEFSSFIDFIETDDPCILAARWVNDKDQVYGVATWGKGKGVIFSSEGTSLTWKATESLLQQVALKEGACAWN